MRFNKKNYEDPLSTIPIELRNPSNAGSRSVIDAGLKIVGNLEGEGELQIDGRICGDIRCARLIVGKGATVDGNITADEIVVRGKVNGVMRGNRVILQEGAIVHSEIFHKRFTVEEGALFEGTSRMREKPTDNFLAMTRENKAVDQANADCSEARSNVAALQHLIQAEDGETLRPAADQVPLAAEAEIASEVIGPDMNSEMKRIRAQLREPRRA
jgi:cytoskeletal protein CcmA (bactofilin family)